MYNLEVRTNVGAVYSCLRGINNLVINIDVIKELTRGYQNCNTSQYCYWLTIFEYS